VLSPEHDHLAVLAQLGLARQLIKETLGRLTAVLGATPLSGASATFHFSNIVLKSA